MSNGASNSADRSSSSKPPQWSSGVTELKWHKQRSGTRLGRFRLGARLGMGGAASVYLGRLEGPHDFERLAAVKIIHEHLSEEPEFVSMFLDEANLAVKLSHPNIVHIYELGRDGDTLFLAMEYLHGRPLSVVQRAIDQRGRRLPFDVLAWIGARAADGLHHAHELKDDSGEKVGLVHRDVSPDNVFVTYEGHIKLIDFGIARAKKRLTTTELGKVKGKCRYMSPEQALGREIDHRADIFSLGTTLYEAALGAPLFEGFDETDTLAKLLSGPVPDPRSRIPGFPAKLAPIVLRALEPEPTDRYPDAGQLSKDLEAFAVESGGGQRERLAKLMQDLFQEQRDEEKRAIAALRALPSDSPDQRETKPGPPSPELRKLWRMAAIVGVPVLLGAAAVIALVVGREPASTDAVPGPSAAAIPATVTIDVRSQPAVKSVIEIDGRVIDERPARLKVPRSDRAVGIVVKAKGYETAKLEAVPDRDQFLVVPLIRGGQKPAAAAASASSATATRPGSAATASRPGGKGGKGRKAGTGGRPGGKKPPLVTDYPF